uniref:Uncharacterized protein n=1 Tax=Wuchereria bancrofti TaxID=6293 RepID=A0A1I8ESI0_WUCBA
MFRAIRIVLHKNGDIKLHQQKIRLEGHGKEIAAKSNWLIIWGNSHRLFAEISFCDAQLLSNLQCDRCNEEENINENEKDDKFCKRKQRSLVSHSFFFLFFVLESAAILNKGIPIKKNGVWDNIFHLNQDDFTVEQESAAILKDSTLKIMYYKLVDHSPDAISEFETFVHSLSIFARLIEDSNIYGFVVKQLLSHGFPITGKNKQVITAWEVMLSSKRLDKFFTQ